MTDLTSIKNRFGIIGNSEALNRALEVALRVAPTDLSVLVTGESGVGKEFFPQVIHAYSARKHNKYIAVNCGAIPEGTIDSELFGHEKGAFTGAVEARKGYFEEADGGTIFLDEVAELPHSTQVRLLRVLQTGEFIRVGSAKVQKTNVRVVAATNTNLQDAIQAGRFREDLYYRLNTVPIQVPPLRERKEDIFLLFRKFAADVAAQYRMPAISLDPEARQMLENYYWRGNIRQLKNVAEQISAIEEARLITPAILTKYLPAQSQSGASTSMSTALHSGPGDGVSFERELLYKVLFDLRADVNDLKRMLTELMQRAERPAEPTKDLAGLLPASAHSIASPDYTESEEVVDEQPSRELTKADVLREQILRALRRNNGRRREAAAELFMSERTLYRRMKAVLKYAIVVAAGLLLAGCGYKVNYSLSGASIPPDAKTFSVAYFPNNAPMVAPILSSTLTDALRDKFTRQTRLTQVDEGGDFAFEGEITGYTSTTASVSGSSETALLNRLTITVNVRFTNAVDESMSWKKTFSAFEDFDSSKLLNEIEGELIPQIVDKLVTDIFQASAANW